MTRKKHATATITGALAGVLATASALFETAWHLLSATSGTWFTAVVIGATKLLPNLSEFLNGDLTQPKMVMVGAGVLYLSILALRVSETAETILEKRGYDDD